MLISGKIIKKQIFSWIKCKPIVAMPDSTINGIQNNYGGIKLLNNDNNINENNCKLSKVLLVSTCCKK